MSALPIAVAVLAFSVQLFADEPLSPADSQKSFDLAPGLRVELVASEPLISSPVAMAFDARGRLFVAENRGYPTGPTAGGTPLGKIALLEDTDFDGRMDKRTDVAEGLTFPNGVLPWRDGVIVTCSPEILFLRDTNDDGKADERRVLFNGFATTGSTQLRASHPMLSSDGWVYVTGGLSGGKIISPQSPEKPPLEMKRSDFRFRPDGGEYETAGGGGQFGLTFDDFGRRFVCYNRVHVQHVVLPPSVLTRLPLLSAADTLQNCPEEMVVAPLPGHGAAARLYPLSKNVTTADSHAGTFTAACGVTIFRGDGLPEAYRGGVFACDPTANLVHFDRLEPHGATFVAKRIHENSEFLRSPDACFRPVFLSSGPDGALYICDMTRKTIEHPDYLPAEIRKHTDFETGRNLGRIWRVVSKEISSDELKSRRQATFSKATTEELVAALRHADGWHRDTAHRLLLELRDEASIPLLKTLLRDKEAKPPTIVQTAFLLHALGNFDDVNAATMLRHSSPRVNEACMSILSERTAFSSDTIASISRLANDDDARVRFTAALTLGTLAHVDSQRGVATASLTEIIVRDQADRWTRTAVWSSLEVDAPRMLNRLLNRAGDGPAYSADLLKELGRRLAANAYAKDIAHIVLTTDRLRFEEQAALLIGLTEGSRIGNDILIPAEERYRDETAKDLAALMQQAKEKLASDKTTPVVQTTCVNLLGLASFEQAGESLIGLLAPGRPPELQSAAIRSLGKLRDARTAAILLESSRWNAYSPALREEALAVITSMPEYVKVLFTEIESGRVSAGSVDALRRKQLTQHRDADIRARAEKLFGTVTGDRAKVYEELKSVADMPGDSAVGRDVFRRACASCHRLDQEGFAVGPDLFGIRNQPKAAILLHILVPDHEIAPGFLAYNLVAQDGRMFTGLIVSESAGAITLRMPQGKEERFLREDLEEIAAGRGSLMPQGLEKSITRQEIADLLAYLKGERPISQGTTP